VKVLIVNQTTCEGIETDKVFHAKTLKKAFKKASMREWQYYRIYQVYNNLVPYIVFESVLNKNILKSKKIENFLDLNVKTNETKSFLDNYYKFKQKDLK